MTKYKLLKDLPFDKEWTIIDSENRWNLVMYPIISRYSDNKEWFEEIKEPKTIYNLKEWDKCYILVYGQALKEDFIWEYDMRLCMSEIFLTKQEAETELKKRKALAKIKKWSVENDWDYKLKWNTYKYYLYLNWLDEETAEITVQETYLGKYLWTIYYSSEKKAEQALKELREEYNTLFWI